MSQICISLAGLDKIVHRINNSTLNVEIKRKDRITTFDKYNPDIYSNRSFTKLVNPINRFQKHNNLIQTNRSQFIHTANTTIKNRNFSIQCKENFIPRKNRFKLQPKNKNHFFMDFSKDNNGLYGLESATSQNLQGILMKNRLKNHRNLLGYNILKLEQKFHFSRFQLHNLYSLYHTLLRDSKGDIKRFKSGFQVILNMIKIALRPQILQSIFIEQQKLDFQSFIEMYSKIDHAIFKQTIIDYVQIMFEGIYNNYKIRYEDIVRIMKNRITQKQSEDIANIIFQQLQRKIDQTVSIKEIYRLCSTCQTFAQKMFRLYSGQTQ